MKNGEYSGAYAANKVNKEISEIQAQNGFCKSFILLKEFLG